MKLQPGDTIIRNGSFPQKSNSSYGRWVVRYLVKMAAGNEFEAIANFWLKTEALAFIAKYA